MTRPRLLDLFCGAGGAAMGYHRAGFDVVGVDAAPQPAYPFAFVQADAMTYPLEGFDAIHASPPCQGYSRGTRGTARETPRLVAATVERLTASGLPFAVENVEGAEADMPWTVTLCGSMFGLATRRHRLFVVRPWTAPPMHPPCHVGAFQPAREAIRATGIPAAADPRVWAVAGHGRRKGTARVWALALGASAEWGKAAGQYQTKEAIPPAYTEWVGRQLMAAL